MLRVILSQRCNELHVNEYIVKKTQFSGVAFGNDEKA